MIPIHDDLVPAPRPRARRLLSAAALVAAIVIVVSAVAGVVTWLRPEGDDSTAVEEQAAPGEPTFDRAEEVLGEVFTRPDADVELEAPDEAITSSPPPPPTTTNAAPDTVRRSEPVPRTTTTTSAPERSERPTHAPPPLDLTFVVDGNVVITQFFSSGSQEREPNTDCEALRDAYDVVVRNPQGDVIGLAELTGGAYERQDGSWGGTTTRCTYDYTVRVPEIESETYVFTLAEASNHDTVRYSETVSEEELRSQGGPTLSVRHRF